MVISGIPTADLEADQNKFSVELVPVGDDQLALVEWRGNMSGTAVEIARMVDLICMPLRK